MGALHFQGARRRDAQPARLGVPDHGEVAHVRYSSQVTEVVNEWFTVATCVDWLIAASGMKIIRTPVVIGTTTAAGVPALPRSVTVGSVIVTLSWVPPALMTRRMQPVEPNCVAAIVSDADTDTGAGVPPAVVMDTDVRAAIA